MTRLIPSGHKEIVGGLPLLSGGFEERVRTERLGEAENVGI